MCVWNQVRRAGHEQFRGCMAQALSPFSNGGPLVLKVLERNAVHKVVNSADVPKEFE
jgi:hypothetical protein